MQLHLSFPLRAIFFAACSFAFICPVRAEQEEEAVRIYRQLRPSVVSISNAEGSGTGIILRPDGLILTNAQVVSSPLPYTVTVETGPADNTRRVTYAHVDVVGYHPTSDLALIRINPQEPKGQRVPLIPVTLSGLKGQPGQRVYVIGDPAGGGMVLTKTITSGMLSGVDRQVEGQSFYQVDAAINPGNSGGPIVDHTGKVLGLVTFKFTDADAMGFAIPLNTLSPKEFVPLTERHSDPARAAEYVKLADKYSNLADAAAKREGRESDSRKLFDEYAAICYRLALTENPSEPTLYYDVGMLLRSLDEDEIAAAYLARGIELRPWPNTPDIYRELGFSLVKQKHNEQALAAWKEGIAKFPYASKIWEDVTIYHMAQKEYVEAAISAATTLLIAEKDTRTIVMRGALNDARSHLGASEASDVESRSQDKAIVAMLDQMLAASNATRKARKLYVTAGFSSVITALGGPELAGVEKAIDIQPKSRPPEVAQVVAPSGAGAGVGVAPSSGKDSGWIGATAPPIAPKTTPPSSIASSSRNKNSSGNDWIGGPAASNNKSGNFVPAVTGQSLADHLKHVTDAEVTPLQVGNVVGMQWLATAAGDPKFAVMVEKTGIVRKVSVPDLIEERHIDLAAPCSDLAVCRQGILIALDALQEVWLLDENLQVKKRIASGPLKWVQSAPSLSVAYCGAAGDSLVVLDTLAGRALYRQMSRDFSEQRGEHVWGGVGFDHFAVAPDGQTAYGESSGFLHRFRLRGQRIFYEGTSPHIGENPQSISVSGDSKYVALPSGGGNSQLEGFPRTPYATYIFRCEDLTRPVITIESGAYPTALGFDMAAKSIYAQNFQKQLITFSPTGLKGKEYSFEKMRGADTPHQFLVLPSGGKMFVRMGGGATFWINLP